MSDLVTRGGLLGSAKMRRMIDPPSGWKYGFPKELKPNESYEQLLRDSGYPCQDIELALRYSRQWDEPNE